MQNSRSHFSVSLARGLAVIKAFDRDAPMLRITDVANRTGLDRATARRFLLTLVDLQYVGLSGDLFYLRPSALDIGFSYLSSLDPNRLLQPFLNELTETTRETSSFGVLDEFQVRLLARSANNRILNFSIYLGERVPAYRTSLGRVLLAGLPKEQFEAYWASLPEQLRMATFALDKSELRQSVDQTRTQGWAAIDQTMGEEILLDRRTDPRSRGTCRRCRERDGVSATHQHANEAAEVSAAAQERRAADRDGTQRLTAFDDCIDAQRPERTLERLLVI